uniref:(northern house mosquito) hypothetical protein n=1 Tax=Culex pipiens TaxID=7175 RepID=A0A8D8P4N6_CULPI
MCGPQDGAVCGWRGTRGRVVLVGGGSVEVAGEAERVEAAQAVAEKAHAEGDRAEEADGAVKVAGSRSRGEGACRSGVGSYAPTTSPSGHPAPDAAPATLHQPPAGADDRLPGRSADAALSCWWHFYTFECEFCWWLWHAVFCV